jgi:hypothetical protein
MKLEGRRKTMGGGPEIPLASMVKDINFTVHRKISRRARYSPVGEQCFYGDEA